MSYGFKSRLSHHFQHIKRLLIRRPSWAFALNEFSRCRDHYFNLITMR